MKFTKTIIKKFLGVILIILGIIIFITPFTPGSWIFFVGLELLGVRMAIWEKIKQSRRNKK